MELPSNKSIRAMRLCAALALAVIVIGCAMPESQRRIHDIPEMIFMIPTDSVIFVKARAKAFLDRVGVLTEMNDYTFVSNLRDDQSGCAITVAFFDSEDSVQVNIIGGHALGEATASTCFDAFVSFVRDDIAPDPATLP